MDSSAPHPAGRALQLTGALTFANVAALWDEHSPTVSGATALDLSRVSQIDSAGLALITALKRAAGPQCRVTGLTPAIRDLARAYDILPLLEPGEVAAAD